MKTTQEDAFVKLNLHNKKNLNDVELAKETDAITKEEIARIKDKVQRKQLDHPRE